MISFNTDDSDYLSLWAIFHNHESVIRCIAMCMPFLWSNECSPNKLTLILGAPVISGCIAALLRGEKKFTLTGLTERYYFLVFQRWIVSPSPFENIGIRARIPDHRETSREEAG